MRHRVALSDELTLLCKHGIKPDENNGTTITVVQARCILRSRATAIKSGACSLWRRQSAIFANAIVLQPSRTEPTDEDWSRYDDEGIDHDRTPPLAGVIVMATLEVRQEGM